MYWSAAEFILLATSALFLTINVVALSRNVEVPRLPRFSFALAAVVCAGAAVALATIEVVYYPKLLWLLPIIPTVILGTVLRDIPRRYSLADAVRTKHESPGGPDRMAGGGTPRAASSPAIFQAGIEPELLIAVAPETPSIGGEWLKERLSDDATARARAHNPYTHPAGLAELAYGYPSLRAVVAANPGTPSQVLEWLATTGDSVVAAAIAARGSSSSLGRRVR